MRTLTDNELSTVCGGSFLEAEICQGGKHIDIYRSGVTYVNTAFGSDTFYVGSKQISKDTADKIATQGRKLWMSKYQASGDLVAFTKEWKVILANDFGIAWDGKMGEYKTSVF